MKFHPIEYTRVDGYQVSSFVEYGYIFEVFRGLAYTDPFHWDSHTGCDVATTSLVDVLIWKS